MAFPATYGVMFLISGPDLFLQPAAVVAGTPPTLVLVGTAIHLFLKARKARQPSPIA